MRGDSAPALANIPAATPLENRGPPERHCSKLRERPPTRTRLAHPGVAGVANSTGESRMIRLSLAAALAGGLVWVATGSAAAQDRGVPPQTEKINELIAKGWESAGIKMAPGKNTPVDKAKDHEFMRRAFIDLLGRIPTPEEIRDFETDNAAGKRARLITRLLYETKYTLKDGGRAITVVPGLKLNKDGAINYNDAYAENFAELWTTWLLTRSNTHPLYRDQLRLWLTQQFAKGKPWTAIVEE